MTDQPQQAVPLPIDEHDELVALRAEVESLRAAVDSGTTKAGRSGPRPGWWRRWVSIICIVLGGILVPLSVASVWARAEVTDTSRYVQTITPLAAQPALQSAVSTQITNQLFDYLNIPQVADQVVGQLGSKGILPPLIANQLKSLEQPIVNGIKGFVQTQVSKFVASKEFQAAWIQANEVAHAQLVATLSGQGPTGVSVSGGRVSVNLAAVINAVKAKLVADGFGLAANIPNVNATFTIFSNPNVTRIQTAYRILDRLGVWLPTLAVLLFGLGIFVAADHRRAFIGAGITVLIAAMLCALALALGRVAYLNAISSDVLPRDAAAIIFDTVIRFLRDGIRNTAILGATVAAGAFGLGPSVTAVRVRQIARDTIGWLRRSTEGLGLHLGVATDWVAPRVRMLRVLTTIGVALLFALWPYRTPAVTIWHVVGLLVGLVVIQFLASPASESTPAAA